MEPTPLEPDNPLDTARVLPIVTVIWGALTAWAGSASHHTGWRPIWLYPSLVALMSVGLLVLLYLSVESLIQYRALREATTSLDRSHLTIGDTARLSVATGADPAMAMAVDVHLEGREYTRKFVSGTANVSGGWREKTRLVHRTRLGEASVPEGSRLHNLPLVVPDTIHPSVIEKPHGINWTLRVRIKAGKAPPWDAKYPVKIRGRNGSGINIDSQRREFQFPGIPDDPLPKLRTQR
ncbi:hypothetical protein [Mycobacterium decipiens]|uniref:Uncharacterized protein n=1 Tax=Mycobacterium decipiens TaxID=1430326 RepID=A0A1X2LVI9_9MYCO|nr:hypothetical protein [Mycobacterium decipiens]OSC41072.1 hypothetical protein B8W66_09995 [Mycobacterium decipiens]